MSTVPALLLRWPEPLADPLTFLGRQDVAPPRPLRAPGLLVRPWRGAELCRRRVRTASLAVGPCQLALPQGGGSSCFQG